MTGRVEERGRDRDLHPQSVLQMAAAAGARSQSSWSQEPGTLLGLPQGGGQPLLLSREHQKGIGSEKEQSGLKLSPVRDVTVAGSGLTLKVKPL